MFQRLSSLFFGEVQEAAAELKGPNPCVTDADEEGWMLVNLPAEADCMMQAGGGAEAPQRAQSLSDGNQSNQQDTLTRTGCPAPVTRPPNQRRRTHKGRARESVTLSAPLSCPSASPSVSGAITPVTLPRQARLSTPSTPSMSPGSRSECGGSGGSSRAGSERGCMDESWFVTPPPCFTAEGATAEASPMEDLLIEHPSMSVYVSSNNLSMVSNGNLSVVGEESIISLTSSVRVAEPAAAPAARSAMPTRVSRGTAAQAGALAKVTQMARVQRSKARIERRHLGRNRIQRQNRTREQVPRHAAHTRNTFLHQPSQRSFYH
ncbi:tumor protein p53-inducible nuclear protein 2 isoform X2 [Lampris incognitus]|uniref:tumor protein p53-inducible nuclear protein 2 isoform X2 n=1 Tax=Lampris incognitus TaxID=2546036 RepID=UPI0024B54262|nr:tumor protein p53-inducible nuclear protein 2 isoform X2 [Lampris incognitus]